MTAAADCSNQCISMFTIASSPEDNAASKKVRRERRWSVVLCCAVATMLSLTSGVTLAIPSNVILDVGRGSSEQHLTTFQQSVFSVRSISSYINMKFTS